MFMSTQFYRSILLLASLGTCLWLPCRAQAQFSFTLSPSTLSAAPGTNNLTFSGTLTNVGSSALANDEDPAFNLLTGPLGEDLNTFPIYLDNFYAPASIAPGQTVSQIFSVNIDSSAMQGQYTGNISFSFGGKLAGQDVTVNAVPAAIPEGSTLLLLALGITYLGFVFWHRRVRGSIL